MNRLVPALLVVCVGVVICSLMLGVYQQGREAGIVDGMTAGFDLGYKVKKPPVVIVTPPRDGTITQKWLHSDSVLWRI